MSMEEKETYLCSICGKDGPFSNRQLNKAKFGQTAKCKTCVSQESETPQKTKETKEDLQIEKDPKETTKEKEDIQSPSVEQPLPSIPKKKKQKKKKKDESRHPTKQDLPDNDEGDCSEKDQNRKTKITLEFSDGNSIDDNGSSSSSSSSSRLSFEQSQEAETPMSVSLNDLKQKILGRPINTEDDESYKQNLEEEILMEQEANTTSVVDDSLQRDLSCAICHEVFYQPMSLPCGHTFCQECLNWWFDQNTNGRCSCPTCRQALACPRAFLKVNTSLKACVVALFGKDLVARIKAKRQSTKGEHGGAHSRGYESISPLMEEVWRTLNVIGGREGDCVKVRRSIVLDGEDQRMQLALAVYDTPVKLQDGFEIQMCLITMEEDEAAEGFPITVCDAEDEHFICTQESRFQISTCLEVRMKLDTGRIVPAARLGFSQINEHGALEFCLNRDSAPSVYHQVSSLLFSHDETGAELEIDLALLRKGASGGKFVPTEARERANPVRRSYVYDEDDEMMDQDEDEFEDDGFVVDDDHESDVEGNFSGDEEEHELCYICKDGGELMVCDGGEEMKGCGKSVHSLCVKREKIPGGDWVCSECANASGLDTGIEGHEFPGKTSDAGDGGSKERWDEESSGSGNELSSSKVVMENKTDTMSNEKKRKFSGGVEESSDEEFGTGDESSFNHKGQEGNPIHVAQQSAKRRIIDDSDSDDE